MTSVALLHRITDFANRPDPYPLYAELRRTPVVRDEAGPYLVSTYWEIRSLLHDPRISSDARNLTAEAARATGQDQDPDLPPNFLRLDPPEHDRLRRLAMAPSAPRTPPAGCTTCTESSPMWSPGSSTAAGARSRSISSTTSPIRSPSR